MTRNTAVLALAFCVGVVTAASAADQQIGTWKLNESKSKIVAGATKNHTVVYEVAGDNIKVTVDGVDGTGNAIHSEWVGKFDGKDYPLKGDPTSDTRAYTRVDDHTLTLTQKKGGKLTTSGRIVIAADGKSRTVTTDVTDAQGQKVSTTAVYDRK